MGPGIDGRLPEGGGVRGGGGFPSESLKTSLPHRL